MDLDNIMDWAEKNIDAEYVEVRGEELSKLSIELKDGIFPTFTSLKLSGFGVRVLAKGAWGFSSTNRFENLKEAIENAYKMAKAASPGRYEEVTLAEIDVVEDEVKSKMRIKPSDVGVDEKVSRMKELEKTMKEANEVASTLIRYEDASGKKILYTSEGTRIVWDMDYIWQYIWLTGKNERGFASARDEIGSVDKGWELFEKENVETISNRLLKKLRAQLNGVQPKRGEYPLVAGPIMVGIIAHEALGHLAEADLTINSPFRDLIGKQIAPEFVNMSDRIVEDGFGNNLYDDEGTKVKDVHIIKNGTLTEIMLNREYAAKFGMEPNGHARAENYMVPPIIRMRNTVFEKGDYTLEELFEGIK
ncbi:TldD-like protein, partial [Euryarchaeota archaeon ex4484_178]